MKIKYIFLSLTFLLIFATTNAQIQTYNKAIGIRLTEGSFGAGVNFDFKTYFNERSFFEPICDKLGFEAFAGVAIGFNSFSSSITALVEPHKNIGETGLSWYWGLGASAGFTTSSVGTGTFSSAAFGPRGTGGIEYVLPKHPWAFNVGAIAGFDYVPNWGVPFNGHGVATAAAIYLLDFSPR